MTTWNKGEIIHQSLTNSSASILITATKLPITAGRRSLIVQNTSSGSVWFGSSVVTSALGVEIFPNGDFSLDIADIVSGYCITTGQTKEIRQLEGA